MEKFLLKVLDIFHGVFRSYSIDYDQLRAIVATKLIMDNRRQLVAYRRKGIKDPVNTFVLTLVFYAVFGGFVALAMYNIPSFVLSQVVFFSYIMVMVSMTLITDFSSILLDTSDNTIILPRPVDGKTLFAARLTHILLYLGQLAIALSIIPSIVFLVENGVVLFFAFWAAIGLSLVTALFLTNALYLLIMQFGNEEKLRSIINYFQIIMAIVIMAGYQILPRMIERIDIEAFEFDIEWWSFLIPPAWMAGSLEALRYEKFDASHLSLIACALTLPLLGMFVASKHLSPVFSRKIAMLGQDTSQVKKKNIERSGTLSKISTWITTTSSERAAFELIYKILGRDRKIKLKVYPAFGYVAVFGLIFMMRSTEDVATTWTKLPETQYHLMLLYLMFMVLQVALHEIPYSDDFKGSWIYFSSPLQSPGEILSGAVKGICVRLFLPGFAIISIFVLLIWGHRVWDDIIIAFMNNILMLMILALINKRHLPLSMAPDVRAQSGNLMRGILALLLISALGVGHFLLFMVPNKSILLPAIFPVQAVILYFTLRAYKSTQWSRITL